MMIPEYRYVITDGDTFASDANATHFTSNRFNAYTWSNMVTAENVLANRNKTGYYVDIITTYRVDVDPDISMDVDIIQQFLDIVQDCTERYETLKQREIRLDRQLCDIEHFIESEDLNARDGYKIYKKLQKVRRERRLVKQRLQIMDAIKASGVDIESLKPVLKSLTDVKYRPREYANFDGILV